MVGDKCAFVIGMLVFFGVLIIVVAVVMVTRTKKVKGPDKEKDD